jgi:hypothetical protein
MRQVTAIALFGPKPPMLAATIEQCQLQVADVIGDVFKPYDLRQVHATLLGMTALDEQLHNANLWRHRDRRARMDLSGCLQFLRTSDKIPFAVQIAGFQPRSYPFVSRNRTPYERSFSIQGDKVVVMGWPICGNPLTAAPQSTAEWLQESRLYPQTLDELRRAALRFDVLHTYHRQPTDVDNDLYFRIGLIESDRLDAATQQALEQKLRDYLSQHPSVTVELDRSTIAIAAYSDERLPYDSTDYWPLNDSSLAGEMVETLYTSEAKAITR